MEAAKGKTQPDGTYLFTCGTCGGKAHTDKSIECAWCYGGDVARIAAELKTARGQRYYGLLKSFLRECGKAMVDELKRLKRERGGTFTPVEVAYVSLKFNLNFKATWEWLHETRCIPAAAAYEDLNFKYTVKQAYAAARERYPELA